MLLPPDDDGQARLSGAVHLGCGGAVVTDIDGETCDRCGAELRADEWADGDAMPSDEIGRRPRLPSAAARRRMLAGIGGRPAGPAGAAGVIRLRPAAWTAEQAAWREGQATIAAAYLEAHADDDDAGVTLRRAAVITRAEPWQPEARRRFGLIDNEDVIGKQVTCRICRHRYRCDVERPYLDATSCLDGICATCAFLPSTAHAPAPARAKHHARPAVITLDPADVTDITPTEEGSPS